MKTQKRTLLSRAILLGSLFVGLGGCAITYREDFERQAQAKGWTQDQVRLAYYYSLRLKFLKKEDDGTYSVVYSVLPRTDAIAQLERTIADLEVILDYKSEEWNRYVSAFELRPYFLRQELVFKATLARLLAAENDQKFREFLGESSPHRGGLYGQDPSRGYDEAVLNALDVEKEFPFKSNVLEEARATGLLQEIARTFKSDSRTFNQKDPDPDDPTDQNKFVWAARKIAYERVEYKVVVPGEQPQNNKPNYVEIWRMIDGKRESSPAVKAFLDGRGSALLLVDTERESEQIGFGLPNLVTQVSESDLYGDGIIDQIFPDLRQDRRVAPKVHPIHVEIVKAGTPIDPWQVCPEETGCSIPTSYRRLPAEDNYNVRVALKAEKRTGESEPRVRIEAIAKEWTNGRSEYSWSAGMVVEYYKPKPQCSDSALLGAKVLDLENKKKIRVTCKDGTEVDLVVTPSLNRAIKLKPYQVAFTIGETRWVVWDTDNDGKFDKRRKASLNLKYDIGMYPIESLESDHGSSLPEHLIP